MFTAGMLVYSPPMILVVAVLPEIVLLLITAVLPVDPSSAAPPMLVLAVLPAMVELRIVALPPLKTPPAIPRALLPLGPMAELPLMVLYFTKVLPLVAIAPP